MYVSKRSLSTVKGIHLIKHHHPQTQYLEVAKVSSKEARAARLASNFTSLKAAVQPVHHRPCAEPPGPPPRKAQRHRQANQHQPAFRGGCFIVLQAGVGRTSV